MDARDALNRSDVPERRGTAPRGTARASAACARLKTCSAICPSATKTASVSQRFARSRPGKSTPCRRRSQRQPGAVYARTRRHVSLAGPRRHRLARLQIFSREVSRRKDSKPGSGSSSTEKRNWTRYRPGRIEMINPEYELLGAGDADSTEVGRIVPIYEAIGGISSRIDAADHLSGARKFAGPHARSAARGDCSRGTNFLRGARRSISSISRRRRNRSRR